jgi:hypothetical protein
MTLACFGLERRSLNKVSEWAWSEGDWVWGWEGGVGAWFKAQSGAWSWTARGRGPMKDVLERTLRIWMKK